VQEVDTKCLRSLFTWQHMAVSPTKPTTADLVDQAEFSFEDSKWNIGLSVERIGAVNLQGINARSARGNNHGKVVSDAGPYGIVGGVLR
jgi:hypothetical protein